MSKGNLLIGTLILTAATTLTRLIGFVFRIYLANIMGAEGMGLYQLILSFYMLMVTLATSGINIAVSRLMSEEIALSHWANARRVLRQSIILSLFTGFLSALLMYSITDYVSINVLKDSRTTAALMYLIPTLPVMAVSSCYKGYFYAVRKVIRPASAQVMEQIIRVSVIYAIMGSYADKGLEYACAAVAVGMVAEEIFSFIYIWFLYVIDKKPYSGKHIGKAKNMMPDILCVTIPLAATSYMNSALRMVENILIPLRLTLYGVSAGTAMELYGMLKGMVLPLLFFPSSFLTSLASMLIPSVAGANASLNERRVTSTLSLVLHFTLISAILIVAVFICYSYEIGMAVYNNSQVGIMLKVISFVCPFMYLNMVISSMLNALGEQVSSFKINVIESVVKISIIFFLMPLYGFNAYLAALFLTTILNTVLYMARLLQVSCLLFDISNWIVKPILAAAAASVLSRVLYSSDLFFDGFGIMKLVSSALILCAVYAVLLALAGCLRIRK